ncbi:MAG: NAD-dependent epimerase/dehydratase family protein, partial [Chloroflexi bacterium]|nr:NAD-dependent epimerase/dehydratase family protein [Chloroflexota bacterium]
AEFLRFASDFDLSSSVILSTLEIGDIYLSSLKALHSLSYEDALGDVTDYDALLAATRGVDAIFHVAAVATYWRSDVQQMYHVNVEGTRNVLRAAQANGVKRVVVTSSSASIGRAPFGHTVDESAHFNLQPHEYHYGYTKVLAENVVAKFVQQGLDVVIVNPAVIMGPRDVNLIGGSLITELAKRDVGFAPPGGVGMIDVADVCGGQIAAFERGVAGERYILNSHNLWHTEILDVCKRVVGRTSHTTKLPRAVMRTAAYPVDLLRRFGVNIPMNGEQLRLSCDTFWFDPSKARAQLGLTARPFEETAQRTYDWYKANGFI